MTGTNQKLREALLSDMDIAVLRMPVHMAFAGDMAQFQYHNRVQSLLNRIDALALPTADHLPDAGEMVEAAAPVGEREAFERTPLTVLQYNAIPELCAIPPSLYESVVRAIERAHGIDAAMRKDKP